MIDVINWYWNFGIQREGEHSIGIGKWLDVIEQMRRRDEAIRNNLQRKRACIAVWGPSQTGKSTMISDAIDANDSGDGKNSALTWSDKELARFTGDAAMHPETVIFNPYNGGSDGSGVPTRYVLCDSVADVEHPVQVKFASRAQIMLALSIGYLEECSTVIADRINHYQYDIETFTNTVREFAANASGATVQRKTVELLQDVADVIAIAILTQDRFKNLKNKWPSLRADLFSHKALLADYDQAFKLVTRLLWDDAEALTNIFKSLMDKLDFVTNTWQGKDVYASLNAANLFLDINTLEKRDFFKETGKQHPCDSLSFVIQGNTVLLDTTHAPSAEIAADNFGLLQALISELIVPLRKQTLESNGKTDFMNLLDKADYLDFPGVPTRNTGTDAVKKVTPANCKYNELLCRVLKQGKTLSMIFMHTRQYAIDSFIILNRFNKYPSKTNVLTQGIQAWLQAYDKNWSPGLPSPLKFYMNLTFFAEEANKAITGAVGPSTISSYTGMIRELPFATARNAKFFLTTYPHFDGCAIRDDAAAKERVLNMFYNDASLKEISGLTTEDYKAVFYEADGGVTYLFKKIAADISTQKRVECCEKILKDDHDTLRTLLEAHLPAPQDADGETIKAAIQTTIDAINTAIGPDDEESDETEDKKKKLSTKELTQGIHTVSGLLKSLLVVPPESLDPIPEAASKFDEDEAQSFMATQLGHWCEYQLNATAGYPDLGTFIPNFPLFLSIMNENCNLESLGAFLRNDLGYIQDSTSADVNRKFLAYAISNCLLFNNYSQIGSEITVSTAGSIRAQIKMFTSSRAKSRYNYPAYQSLIAPFLAHLNTIIENFKQKEPKPQPGENELLELYQKLFKTPEVNA